MLKRQLKRASDLGYTFYVAPELEFFYFTSSDAPVGLDKGGYLDLTPLDVASDVRRQTVLTLEEMGIGVEYSHHEAAPSQHEIGLRYTDALTMADNAMTYRLVVKEVALANDVYASFMPKPLSDENGSGMHTHQSLFKGVPTRSSPDGPIVPVDDREVVHGGAAAARAGDHAGDEPVGEQLQAAGAGVRGAGVRDVGAPQSCGPDPRAPVQAREGRFDARRVPGAGPGVQPVPGVRDDAGGGATRASSTSTSCRPRRRTTSTP